MQKIGEAMQKSQAEQPAQTETKPEGDVKDAEFKEGEAPKTE